MKKFVWFGCFTLALAMVLCYTSVATAASQESRKDLKNIVARAIQGTWVMESQKLPDGTVLEPPDISSLMIITDRYLIFHFVTPATAWSCVEEWEVEGSNWVLTVRSSISVDFPPGTGTITSSQPATIPLEISVEGEKVTLTGPQMPGFQPIWELEGDTLTVTELPDIYDTWKRVEPAGFALPEGIIERGVARALQGTWVMESQKLPDGTVLKPPDISGLSIATDRYLICHFVTPATACSMFAEWEVEGSNWMETLRSWISVDFPPGTGTVTSNQPATIPWGISVEGEKVTLTGPQMPGFQPIWELEGDTLTVTIQPDICVDTFRRVERPEDFSNVFFMDLAPGLNMVSLPLKPRMPHTARSLIETLDATVVIALAEERQKFVGFTADDPGFGFAIEGGKGYIVNVEEGKTVSFVGAAWTNLPPVEAAPPIIPRDSAWAFVTSGTLYDENQKVVSEEGYTVTVKNLRTSVIATNRVSEGRFNAVWADLSRRSVIQAGDELEVIVTDASLKRVVGPIRHLVTIDDITKAYTSLKLKLSDVIPLFSALLANYPNPFNPDTWIPFQLADGARVTIRIYNASGQLVRTLGLGYENAGFYLDRSKAAYWDGKNDKGEGVASGVYFLTIKAGDFVATKKAVMLK